MMQPAKNMQVTFSARILILWGSGTPINTQNRVIATKNSFYFDFLMNQE